MFPFFLVSVGGDSAVQAPQIQMVDTTQQDTARYFGSQEEFADAFLKYLVGPDTIHSIIKVEDLKRDNENPVYSLRIMPETKKITVSRPNTVEGFGRIAHTTDTRTITNTSYPATFLDIFRHILPNVSEGAMKEILYDYLRETNESADSSLITFDDRTPLYDGKVIQTDGENRTVQIPLSAIIEEAVARGINVPSPIEVTLIDTLPMTLDSLHQGSSEPSLEEKVVSGNPWVIGVLGGIEFTGDDSRFMTGLMLKKLYKGVGVFGEFGLDNTRVKRSSEIKDVQHDGIYSSQTLINYSSSSEIQDVVAGVVSRVKEFSNRTILSLGFGFRFSKKTTDLTTATDPQIIVGENVYSSSETRESREVNYFGGIDARVGLTANTRYGNLGLMGVLGLGADKKVEYGFRVIYGLPTKTVQRTGR